MSNNIKFSGSRESSYESGALLSNGFFEHDLLNHKILVDEILSS